MIFHNYIYIACGICHYVHKSLIIGEIIIVMEMWITYATKLSQIIRIHHLQVNSDILLKVNKLFLYQVPWAIYMCRETYCSIFTWSDSCTTSCNNLISWPKLTQGPSYHFLYQYNFVVFICLSLKWYVSMELWMIVVALWIAFLSEH